MSITDTTYCENRRAAPQRSTADSAADCRSNLEESFGESARSGRKTQRSRGKREKSRISARWRHCPSEARPSARER